MSKNLFLLSLTALLAFAACEKKDANKDAAKKDGVTAEAAKDAKPTPAPAKEAAATTAAPAATTAAPVATTTDAAPANKDAAASKDVPATTPAKDAAAK